MIRRTHDGLGSNDSSYRPVLERRRALPVVGSSDAKILFVTVVFFLGYRLLYLNYGLWNDEVFSVWTARLDWSGLINRVREDIVHPPLFYLLLKCWISIGGESLFWLRLFPVMTAMAALVPFYFLCRELRLTASEINLALVLMAVNGYLVLWVQNLRMYSLLLFFTLCSLWMFVKFLNSASERGKWLVSLFAVNLLLVYTHYYGWLLILGELFYLLLSDRRKFRSFGISAVCVVMFFIPWAYAVAEIAINREGLGQLNWVPRPDWRHFMAYFGTLNGLFMSKGRIAVVPAIVGTLLFGYPILWWARHVIFKAQREKAHGADVTTFWLLGVFAFLPAILSYSISQVSPQSIWQTRHLIISAVPYLILVAVSVNRLRPNWVRKGTVAVLVGWAALAGLQGINREKISWMFLIHQMTQAEPHQSADIDFYVLSGSSYSPIRYYLELANEKRFRVVRTKELSGLDGERFWIAVRESPWEEKQKFSRQTLKSYLTSRGYQLGHGFESGPQGQRAFLFPVWSVKK